MKRWVWTERVLFVLGLALIIAALIMMATLPDAFAEKGEGASPSTSERGSMIDPPMDDYPERARNPVVYVERLDEPMRRWFYLDVADGSQWIVTRCRNDEVTGNPRQTCWWNAATMGNGKGRSLAVLKGVKHWYAR